MRKRLGRITLLTLCALILATLGAGFWIESAFGQTGLKGYSVNIVDELGTPITESVTLTITNSGGDTQTVYSDAYGTAIGSTLTAQTNGAFKWWGKATSYSVIVSLNDSGILLTKPGITPISHLIVIPKVTMATVSPAQITLAAGKTIYGDPNGTATALVFGPELTSTGGTLALSNVGVAAGKMALANGKVYIGNTGGTAVAQTVAGCISISNAGVASITDGTIANADIAGDAGIVVTKLAIADGKIPIGGSGGAGAAQTITGAASISNAGVLSITAGTITNTEVASNAAIAGSKLQALSVGVNAGALPITGIANAHIAADADIAGSKLADGGTTAAKLATAVQDLVPYLTVTGADDTDGTGTATIQVKDAAGNNLAQRFRVRTWISTADFGAPVARTDFSVTTGTQLREITANADYEVISDATGLVVMNIDEGGAGTVYVMAEINGRIYSSGAIAITSV